MTNPFHHSGLAGKDTFCNRKKELQQLRRSMENGERAFLYSERRIGKTSLVKQALASLSKQEYLGAYVDLWPTDDEISFSIAMARGIAESLASRADKMLDVARQFFGAMAPSITVDSEGKPTLTFAQRDVSGDHPDLRNVISSPAAIARRRKRKIVVVLDEFQRILDYPSDIVERTLRSIIQDQQAVSYIFLGSRKHLIRQMFLDQNRPLYRSGSHYPLGPIATEDWIPFIRTRFLRSGREIKTDLIRDICNTTGGHPFYTQHLCHVIWELSEANQPVERETLGTALDTLLERESYAYTVLWESLGINHQRFLKGLANEPRGTRIYSAEFVGRYRLTSPASAQRVVKVLLDRDLIDHDNGSFVITDRFFGSWVRRVGLMV